MTQSSIDNLQTISPHAEEVAQMLAGGRRKNAIVKHLVRKRDMMEESADMLVDQVQDFVNRFKESPEGRQLMAKKYKRHMVSGILWFVGGIIVTIATLAAAASKQEGGTYLVAWGAIIFGLIDFFVGLSGWLKYKD